MELAHTLEQRNFIPHHHNRLKLSLKEAAYALHQAKMPVRQKRATSLFCRHLFVSRCRPRGEQIFRANLGPGTRQHDLEDLLASGMKNYGARRLKSCRQEPLKVSCGDVLAEAFRSACCLTTTLTFPVLVRFRFDCPEYPNGMGAQSVDGSYSAGFRRRERDGCGAEASAVVALVRLEFSGRGCLRGLSAHGFG